MIKYIKIIIAIVAIILLGSCEKLRQLINYDVPVEMEYTLTIPANPVTDEIIIDPISMQYDIQKQIDAYTKKTGIVRINAVNLSSISVSVPEAYQFADDNLTSLSKLIIEFNSASNTNWARFVDLNSIPTEKYFLELPVDKSINFKSYFDTETFYFKAIVAYAKPTTKEVKCTFKVKVNINVSL